MANVDTGDGGGGHGRHQKKRAKKLSTRIDMTPMVDLGFLLLTFFMLTTTFSQPKVIKLTPPVKTKETTKIQDSLALTLILTKNNMVYYYNGKLTVDSTILYTTDFSDKGLRQLILNRNHFVLNNIKPIEEKFNNHLIADTTFDKLKELERRKMGALFVIIKTDSLTKYVNVVNALDEMNICNVGQYALVDISQQDKDAMAHYNVKNNIR